MTIVTDTWRQLVQRRLWPVALLLLGALVAVPFLLAKSPEPVPAPPAAVPTKAPTASAAGSEPIVALVSDEESKPTRRVLGVRHNPFAASARIKKTKTKKQSSAQTAADPAKDQASEGSTGGTAPVADPAPTAPTQPMETVPAGSIAVRFGSGDGELPLLRVGRLEALPDEDEPLLVYMGLKDNGKTAIFMVDDSLTPTGGDGSCPQESCETIELKAGETEFFEAKAADGGTAVEYQLDVVKLYKNAAKVPATGSGSSSGATGSAG